MSPPGRPKGESRRAQPEGSQASPPGRPKGESRRAQPEGSQANPPGRPRGESRRAQPEGSQASPPGRPKGETRKAQPAAAASRPPGDLSHRAATQPPLELLLCGSWSDTERDTWAAALRGALPGHRLHLAAPAGSAIDVAIVANPPPGALQGLPGLKLIQSLWAGVDRLLADPTVPPLVPVARMVDPAMNAAMAETALWAVLALQRGFFRYAQQQRELRWQALPQPRADEWSVLVLGLGQMGRAVARALVRQGYRVRGWSRQPAPAEPGVLALAGEAALPQACAGADVLINLLPLTPETRGLLDARRLAWLPHGAAVVNLARGAHVVDADLLSALDAGALSHAVLDVFRTEPLPADHPYWRHRHVTVLPHAAAQTDPRSAAAVVAGNVAAVQCGREPLHLVDRLRGY